MPEVCCPHKCRQRWVVGMLGGRGGGCSGLPPNLALYGMLGVSCDEKRCIPSCRDLPHPLAVEAPAGCPSLHWRTGGETAAFAPPAYAGRGATSYSCMFYKELAVAPLPARGGLPLLRGQGGIMGPQLANRCIARRWQVQGRGTPVIAPGCRFAHVCL